MATQGTLHLFGGVNKVYYTGRTYIRGEYIDFTFPENVIVKSYKLDFFLVNQPAVWYILTYKDGAWRIIDTQDNRNDLQSDVTAAFAQQSTFSGTLRTPTSLNNIRLHIAESTGPCAQITNFQVFDIEGFHTPFLIPFCQKTNSSTHTGSLNFSCIDRFSIDAPKLDTTYFAVKHNFLEVGNGMARLKWN